MKIITRGVLDWSGNILDEESYEYSGPVADCKSSGSAPQPVDPYAQASAQYGLATGAANYNAALNRTNSSNPLGSSTWSVTGTDGPPAGTTQVGLPGAGIPGNSGLYGFGQRGIGPGLYGGLGASPSGSGTAGTAKNGGSGAPLYSQQTSLAPWANQMLSQPLNTSQIPGAGGQLNNAGIAGLGNVNTAGIPGLSNVNTSGIPGFSQFNTSGIPGLSNIDTSNIPGMPGSPSLTQSLQNTQNANYNQQMGYLQPQQQQQTASQNAQLAAQGITPGSEAYNNAQGNLGRQQTFANQQAADSAILAGNQEQATLYGLGTQSLTNQLNLGNASLNNQIGYGNASLQNQLNLGNSSLQNQLNYGNSSLQNQLNYGNSSLQNQLAERNAPISEYQQLQGNGGSGVNAQINAQTPDISGAFNQQYQGALAGYNANTATNNANTQAGAGLASAALTAFMMY